MRRAFQKVITVVVHNNLAETRVIMMISEISGKQVTSEEIELQSLDKISKEDTVVNNYDTPIMITMLKESDIVTGTKSNLKLLDVKHNVHLSPEGNLTNSDADENATTYIDTILTKIGFSKHKDRIITIINISKHENRIESQERLAENIPIETAIEKNNDVTDRKYEKPIETHENENHMELEEGPLKNNKIGEDKRIMDGQCENLSEKQNRQSHLESVLSIRLIENNSIKRTKVDGKAITDTESEETNENHTQLEERLPEYKTPSATKNVTMCNEHVCDCIANNSFCIRQEDSEARTATNSDMQNISIKTNVVVAKQESEDLEKGTTERGIKDVPTSMINSENREQKNRPSPFRPYTEIMDHKIESSVHEDEYDIQSQNCLRTDMVSSSTQNINLIDHKIETTTYEEEHNNETQEHINGTTAQDLCYTPKNTNNELNGIKTEICESEHGTAPEDFCENVLLPVSRIKQQDEGKTLVSTKEKRTRLKNSILEDEIATDRKRRKSSTHGEYENFYNSIKLELGDMEINELEAIDLLHDLDTVMEFRDSKTSSDMLLSSSPCNYVMQDSDEYNSEFNKEPSIDPLLIDNDDQKVNSPSIDKQVQNQKKFNIKSRSSRQRKDRARTVNILQLKNQYDLSTDAKRVKKKLKLLEKQEELPEDVIDKLNYLKIKLIHDVPPQHKIESNIAHTPSQQEKRAFEEYGPLRKGTYSPPEDKIIKKNWETFCEIHSWDPNYVQPFLSFKYQGRYLMSDSITRHRFLQFLANGLPWRTLYSVHLRFKNLFATKRKTSRYSLDEDRKILAHMQGTKHKNHAKFAELAKVLGRTKQSVWLRYQLLKKASKHVAEESSKKSIEDVKWTLALIKKFIQTLMNITLSETIEELKDASIPKTVWQKMEEKLNINHDILKNFWLQQLHMQLFCKQPIYLNDIKIQLIEYMYGKGISHTREIIWPNVAKYFDGMTSIFLCKVFFHTVKECHKRTTVYNFADIIEHLYTRKVCEIKEDPYDKYLPRLVYDNGKIKVVTENTCDSEDEKSDSECNTDS